jgi:hypothetical protein
MTRGSTAAAWLTKKVGVMKALQLGNIANTVFYVAMGAARKGWHLYAACECSTV